MLAADIALAYDALMSFGNAALLLIHALEHYSRWRLLSHRNRRVAARNSNNMQMSRRFCSCRQVPAICEFQDRDLGERGNGAA